MAYHRPRFFLCHRNLANRRAAHTAVATQPGEGDNAHHQWRAISIGPGRLYRRFLGLGPAVGHRLLLGSFQVNPWAFVPGVSRHDRFFPQPPAPWGRRGYLGRDRTPSSRACPIQSRIPPANKIGRLPVVPRAWPGNLEHWGKSDPDVRFYSGHYRAQAGRA